MDEENRTVEAQFYSGAEILRWSWSRGEYLLTFLTGSENVRLEALNKGTAPVLNAHDSFAMGSQIGVINKGEIRDGAGFAELKYFKEDPEADLVWNKVRQGARNVSMGAYVHKMREVEGSEDEDTISRFEAVDWEPIEVSNVPIGADPDAQIQMSFSGRDQDMIEVEILRAEARTPKEVLMPEKGKTAGETPAQEKTAVTDEKTIAANAVKLERERVAGIHKLNVPSFNLKPEFVQKLIADEHPIEKARELILDEMASRDERTPTNPVNEDITITRDETETRRELAASVLLNSIHPKKYEVDKDNYFRGMRVKRMAEELLTRGGVSVLGKDQTEIFALAMQNTADFPYILENVARKQLLTQYEVQDPSYRIWTKQSTTPDFKTMSRTRLSEAPAFLTVPEGGQITIAAMTESRETYAIATYGRGVSFTRQMFINDDLGAFTDLVGQFGTQAAILENTTVYAILNANAAMADGTELFHADHGNLGTGVIGNTALDAGDTAMGKQTGLDGVSILNIRPKYLIVPRAKAVTARMAMVETGPGVKAADQNHFAGMFDVVADAALDGTSAVVWYFAADPAIYPGIEYSHLEGAEGPQIVRKENEQGILGVQLYGYVDFGAKAVDWRSLYKSSGA